MTSASNRELEILGLISTQYASETHAAKSADIDKIYLSTLALAHEQGGFDRVLIGYNSASPDGFQVAAFAAAKTTRLKFLLAHRPGFVAPTLAARQLASLDQLSDGRLAVHIITGGSDQEQARDGDFLSKDDRYARSDEYLELLKKTWTSTAPFDHEGRFYRVEDNFAAIKPLQNRKFLFRGFDPLEDAIEYGRKLLPLFREAARRREVPLAAGAEARS